MPHAIYVDVDDTFVRTLGRKRIPIPQVLRRLRLLRQAGAELCCWSSGGAAYALERGGVWHEDCFVTFLPKPQGILDDQPPAEWRLTTHVYPGSCDTLGGDDYDRDSA